MQKLKLEFLLNEPFLPRELDKVLVSFLKGVLQNRSEQLYQDYYGTPKMKSYTFSEWLPGVKFKNEKILLSEPRFSVFFSTPNAKELFLFYNAFLKAKGQIYPLNQNSMQLEDISLVPLAEVITSEIIIKMLSPMIARKHDRNTNTDTFYTFDQDGFEECIKESLKNLLKQMGHHCPVENFRIIPLDGKKVVATTFGRMTDANLGFYRLEGDPQLLNFLCQSGIGSFRSQGHGAFQVISQGREYGGERWKDMIP